MDLSHPLEQISERGLLPKRPFPGPVDLPLVSGAFLFVRCCATPAIAQQGEPAMPDLFALAMPWWEFIRRAAAVQAVVLGMVRLSGKRATGRSPRSMCC